MYFDHRRYNFLNFKIVKLNKLQTFILLLEFCRQLLVEEKEGLLGDIAFLQVL